MLFNSYAFVFGFLPLALAGWHLAARFGGGRAAGAILLATSLIFHALGSGWFVLLLGASLLFNYCTGRQLGIQCLSRAARRGVLIAGVGANLGVLGYFKYAGFAVSNANTLLGFHWAAPSVVLPLGISFYTFQQISYLVDSARGITRGYQALDYCLFVSFFPHLIAGPIVHHSDLVPQLRAADQVGCRAGAMAEGLALFTLGLSKKVLIADGLSPTSLRVFAAASAAEPLRSSDAWLGLLAYTFQLYFDFSGYSDMAMGLGRMFGVRIPANFDSPYRSKSLTEFWRRWHMTLSAFIRDYLYIPLGGNRLGFSRTCANLLVAMTLAGLWHGANWTFVLWGALHGCVLAANHAWSKIPGANRPGLPGWLAWFATLSFVALAWVLFRCDSLSSAGRFYRALADFGQGAAGPPLVKARMWLVAILLLAIVRYAPNSQQIVFGFPTDGPAPKWWGKLRWTPSAAWSWKLGMLLAVCILNFANGSEFLYWQF